LVTRDQGVVAVKRAQLDLGLATSDASQALQLSLVSGVGEGQVFGEGTAVAAGKLAGVERDGAELALGDPDLDAAAGEPRVERVVVGVPSQVGLLRDAPGEAAICVGQPLGRGRIRCRSSASRSAGTTRMVRCVRELARSVQASSWAW
jgi:hypothetical protein